MDGESFVQAVLDDWQSAPMSAPLRATLGFLEKLTLDPDSLTPGDADAVRAAGVSDQAIRDAIDVCFLFNTIDRLADATGFNLPPKESHDKAAKVLLKRGYAMPAFLAR